MADSTPDPNAPDPFADSSADEPSMPSWEEEPDRGEMSPSFAADMARLWVQRHQKASLLGAFAVGVFVGAMLRE